MTLFLSSIGRNYLMNRLDHSDHSFLWNFTPLVLLIIHLTRRLPLLIEFIETKSQEVLLSLHHFYHQASSLFALTSLRTPFIYFAGIFADLNLFWTIASLPSIWKFKSFMLIASVFVHHSDLLQRLISWLHFIFTFPSSFPYLLKFFWNAQPQMYLKSFSLKVLCHGIESLCFKNCLTLFSHVWPTAPAPVAITAFIFFLVMVAIPLLTIHTFCGI